MRPAYEPGVAIVFLDSLSPQADPSHAGLNAFATPVALAWPGKPGIDEKPIPWQLETSGRFSRMH